jgi:hypothetical protein
MSTRLQIGHRHRLDDPRIRWASGKGCTVRSPWRTVRMTHASLPSLSPSLTMGGQESRVVAMLWTPEISPRRSTFVAGFFSDLRSVCIAHRPSISCASTSTSSLAILLQHLCGSGWRTVHVWAPPAALPGPSTPVIPNIAATTLIWSALSSVVSYVRPQSDQPISARSRYVWIWDGCPEYTCTSTDTRVAAASPLWAAAPPSLVLLAVASSSPSTTSLTTSTSSSSTASLCALRAWSS